MNLDEKVLARTLFHNKIHTSDGQLFEDLFIAIMNYKERDFQAIKPWGNIGDRKNDGYIKNKGIFYQVFAPENIRSSYPEVIRKLKIDFNGLKTQWAPINEFYFVVNDKYKGINADSAKVMQEIKNEHNLRKAEFLTAKDLEDILFSLEDDQIISITGFIPDPSKVKQLDYSILSEVIGYIMKQPLSKAGEYNIALPDWNEKIKFNNLSEGVEYLLDSGYMHVHSIEEYLANNSNFLADSLRDKVNGAYYQNKDKYDGDELFWAIVNCLSLKAEGVYQTYVIAIMSKYFETCDLFADPSKEE